MKKEDFHENQIVVQVDERGERRSTFFTVVEVHDSHIVVMHPKYGLDAVFYENPRTRYSPATREELVARQIEILDAIADVRKEEQRLITQAKIFQKAVAKLDEANR